MDRGRRQVGQFLFLGCQVLGSNGLPANPDAAPTFSIYDSSGTAIVSNRKLAPQGIGETGYFGQDYQLDSASLAAGQYSVLYKWTVSSTAGRALDRFEILPGGNRHGAYTALEFYERPQANFLVGALEDGTLEKRRGPYL